MAGLAGGVGLTLLVAIQANIHGDHARDLRHAIHLGNLTMTGFAVHSRLQMFSSSPRGEPYKRAPRESVVRTWQTPSASESQACSWLPRHGTSCRPSLVERSSGSRDPARRGISDIRVPGPDAFCGCRGWAARELPGAWDSSRLPDSQSEMRLRLKKPGVMRS
jgi:hypothetical protein